MPTYDYVCESCGHRFEKFQSMKDEPVHTCPICQQESAKRLISAGNGFIFKGSGFYTTDYRSENYKKDKEKAEKNPDTAKSDSTKSEKKGKSKTKAKEAVAS